MRKFWHFAGRKSEFFKDAGIVASGTVIAQAVNFIGYAASTRFLGPSEFGVFAAQVAISSPLAILATGRYEATFLRANSHSRIVNLLVLCVGYSVLFSVIVVGTAGFVLKFFDVLRHLNLYAIFVLVIGQSFLNIITQLSNFNRQYRAIATSRITGALSTQCSVFLMAINGGGENSLSFGLAFGMLISVVFLSRSNYAWMQDSFRFFSVSRLRGVGRRYRDLAMFNAPQALASAFQDTFAIAIITVQFGSPAAGLYALNNRLLRAPISIFAESIGRVLQRYFSDIGSSNAASRGLDRLRSLNRTVVGAVALGAVLFGVTWALGPAVAGYLFSDQWNELGAVIRAAAPYYGAHLAGATLVAIPVAAGAKYRLLSIFGVLGSALYVASFGLAGLLTANIVEAFHLVSAIMVGYFFMLIVYIYKITRARIGVVA